MHASMSWDGIPKHSAHVQWHYWLRPSVAIFWLVSCQSSLKHLNWQLWTGWGLIVLQKSQLQEQSRSVWSIYFWSFGDVTYSTIAFRVSSQGWPYYLYPLWIQVVAFEGPKLTFINFGLSFETSVYSGKLSKFIPHILYHRMLLIP